MAVMCLALGLALASALGVMLLGNALVEQVYLSSESVNRRMDAQITSFRSFVQEQQLSSTDVNAVGQWNREHPKITLTIYGLTTTLSSSAEGAELVGSETGIVVRSVCRLQAYDEEIVRHVCGPRPANYRHLARPYAGGMAVRYPPP